jgi:DNA gyrase subunit A
MVVADPEGFLLTICANGYGKRTPFGPNTAGAAGEDHGDEADAAADGADGDGAETRSAMHYRKQRRGGKGIRDVKTSERNGPVVGVLAVRDGDHVMLMTAQGMVNRTHVDEIRVVGRNTQGVRVMNLGADDTIVSLAKVALEDITEEPAGDELPETPGEATGEAAE